jgi:hypothetical protein
MHHRGEPSRAQLDALVYARSYLGKQRFLANMHRLAVENSSWVPSQGQTVAILKCRAYAGSNNGGGGAWRPRLKNKRR